MRTRIVTREETIISTLYPRFPFLRLSLSPLPLLVRCWFGSHSCKPFKHLRETRVPLPGHREQRPERNIVNLLRACPCLTGTCLLVCPARSVRPRVHRLLQCCVCARRKCVIDLVAQHYAQRFSINARLCVLSCPKTPKTLFPRNVCAQEVSTRQTKRGGVCV